MNKKSNEQSNETNFYINYESSIEKNCIKFIIIHRNWLIKIIEFFNTILIPQWLLISYKHKNVFLYKTYTYIMYGLVFKTARKQKNEKESSPLGIGTCHSINLSAADVVPLPAVFPFLHIMLPTSQRLHQQH